MATNSAPTLATPSFVRGAQDTVVTPDVYTAKAGTAPFTSIQDITKRMGMTPSEALRGGRYMAQQLASLQGLYQANTSQFNRGDLLSRAANLSDGIGRAMKGMSLGQGNLILDSVRGAGGMLVNGVKMYRQVMSGDFGPISKLADLGNELTGSTFFTIEDPDSVAGMIAGTTKEMMKYGIPGSVEGLKARLLSTGMQNYYAKEVLPNIIDSSDVQSLKELAGITSSKTLSMINTNAIQDFAGKYIVPAGQTVQQMQAEYGDLMEAFAATNPDWASTVRQWPGATDKVTNITAILGGSQDFKSAVQRGTFGAANGTVDKFLGMSALFKSGSVTQSIQEKFPYTQVKKDSEWPTVQADPRTVTLGIPDPRQIEAVALPPVG